MTTELFLKERGIKGTVDKETDRIPALIMVNQPRTLFIAFKLITKC